LLIIRASPSVTTTRNDLISPENPRTLCREQVKMTRGISASTRGDFSAVNTRETERKGEGEGEGRGGPRWREGHPRVITDAITIFIRANVNAPMRRAIRRIGFQKKNGFPIARALQYRNPDAHARTHATQARARF